MAVRDQHLKLAAVALVLQQFTSFHIEIPAMQGELAGLHALTNPRIGKQVFQRHQNRRLLAGVALNLYRFIGQFLQNLLTRALCNTDPLRDELFFVALRRLVFHQGADAAATRMAHDDDVLDFEVADGERDGGTGGSERARLIVRRHQIRHVTHDEHVTGVAIGQQRRVAARIAAGDHQCTRALALGQQAVKQCVLVAQIMLLEALETRQKFGYVSHQVTPLSATENTEKVFGVLPLWSP